MQEIRDLKLRDGQWDKRLFRNFGICSVLDDCKCIENVVFGCRFSIGPGGGVGMTPGCVAVCSWWRLLASQHLPLPYP